jgi:hypothetical protein
MYDRFLLPAASVLLGAAAALFTYVGALSGAWQALFTAVSAAFILILSVRAEPARDFFAPSRGARRAACFAGALCLGLSGVICIITSFGGAASASELLLGVFAVFAAVCAPVSRIGVSDPASARGKLLFALVPVCFCTAWIVVFYRDHASDPALSGYWCPLLAIAALTLGFYYAAGFYCGRIFTRRAVFFSAASVLLSVAALPDGAAQSLCFAGCALLQLESLGSLLAPAASETSEKQN